MTATKSLQAGERTQDTELPLEHCAEYDSAAEWCAKRGLSGKIGDPLPANMSAGGALKYINADPESFQRRVREMAYGIAMDGHSVASEPGCVECGEETPESGLVCNECLEAQLHD